jgi:bifunctional ADP-heptose synthase (sugar kinase/adenylyltransferase)
MIIQQQQQFNVLLIGDDCLDVYQYGTVDRLSPEAPVPIFKASSKVELPGMAGNVRRNLAMLGCDVNFLSSTYSRKTRLIDVKSKQHIVRIDEDQHDPQPLEIVTALPPGYDAIVVSDYDKGTVSTQLIRELREEFEGPIFVDTKKRELHHFEGCFVKINEYEYNRLQTICSDVIVTRGEKGVSYRDKFWPAEDVDVSDVTGAGDTFLAALTFEYLRTGSIAESIPFAIKASTVTVQHVGVYAPTLEEINAIRRNG